MCVLYLILFGWRQPRASSAVKIFVDFMHEHWSKLVFHKVKYWSNFYSYFSQCIDRRIFSEIGAIYMLHVTTSKTFECIPPTFEDYSKD